MRKRLLSIFIAMLLLAAALGCETLSVNSEKDMAQIVAKIGDVVITKGDVYKLVAPQLATSGINIYDENLAPYYRLQVDTYLQQVLEGMVDHEVMAQICDRDMPLTEEEIKKVDESVEKFIESVKKLLGYDPEKPDEYEGDIEKDVLDYFKKMGITQEEYRLDELKTAKYNKVMEAFKKSITSTEQEIEDKYYEDLDFQLNAITKADNFLSYKTLVDPDASNEASMTGSYVLVKPAGFLLVKHILLKYEEEDDDAIIELQDSIRKANNELTKLKDEFEDIQDALKEAEEENNQQEIDKQEGLASAKQAEINAKQAEIDDLEDDFEAAKNAAAEKLKDKINIIKAKIQAGESFDELIEEYGEDPGMKEGANAVYGYLIAPETESYKPTDTWDSDFINGVKTLNNTGDVSDAVYSKHGVHIIKLVAGEELYQIPYEQAKSYVKAAAEKEKKDAAWYERLDEAREELNVTVYKDRVKWIR